MDFPRSIVSRAARFLVLAACGLAPATAQEALADRLQKELDGSGLTDERRLEVLLDRARALHAWSVPEALVANDAVLSEARRQDRLDTEAIALAARSCLVAGTEGVTAALLLLDLARETMPTTASVEARGELALIEVRLFHTINEYGLAAEALERALALAERSDRGLMADCLLELHGLFYSTETDHEPRADLERAERLMRDLGDEGGLRRVRLSWYDVLRDQGREREASRLLDELAEEADAAGDRDVLVRARGHRYWDLMKHEEYDAAVDLAILDVATGELLGNDEILALAMDRLAWAHLAAGRSQEAAPFVDRSLAIAEQLELRNLLSVVLDSALELARAEGDAEAMLAYASRRHDVSEDSLGRATRDAAGTRRLLNELRGERLDFHEEAHRQQAALEEQLRLQSERLALFQWLAAALVLIGLVIGLVLVHRGKRRAERMHTRLVDRTEEAHRTEEARLRLERRVNDLERLDGLGLLAAGFAHDFNNLLLTITGNAELIGASADERSREMANKISLAAYRGADLCTRLLDYARPSPTDSELVDLRDVLREACVLLEAGVDGTATLHLDPGGEPLPAEVDRSALEQVLVNLVNNARAPSVEARNVTLRARRVTRLEDAELGMAFGHAREAGAYAWIEVSDDGHGMKPEVLRRVFDPFFTTKFEGRGLGLSAAFGIVKAHGGMFRVHSEEGRGTTFVACLPLTEAPVAAQAPSQERERAYELEPQTTPSNVLVVDDEAGVLAFVQHALSGSGHRVRIATSAAEALRILAQ